MSARYVFTSPRATDMAIEYDNLREARATLADAYEWGHDAGRLQGRLEAVVLMALSACAGACVWLVMS